VNYIIFQDDDWNIMRESEIILINYTKKIIITDYWDKALPYKVMLTKSFTYEEAVSMIADIAKDGEE
jgi:hypothetical protein